MKRAPSDMSEAEVDAWLQAHPGIDIAEARSLLLPNHDYESAGVRFWYLRTLMAWASLWNSSKRLMVDREAARLAVKGAALSSAHATRP